MHAESNETKTQHSDAAPKRTQALRSDPWRRVAVLALALAIAIAGSSGLVWAQNVGPVAVAYSTQTGFLPPKICIGDTGSIPVRLIRTIQYGQGTSTVNVVQRLGAGWIDGEVQNPGIVTLTTSRQYIGVDTDQPGEAEFQFKAIKAGKTKISFIGHGTDGSSGSPAIVDVAVEACKFQVTTTSIWTVPGESHQILVAKIVKAELNGTDQTRLTGTADVKWTLLVGKVEDCTGEVKAGSSTADMTGQVDEDGQITVKINFKQAMVKTKQTCVRRDTVTGDVPVPVTPDPLTVTFPSSGDYDTVDQVLVGPSRVDGQSVVAVFPTK